MSRSDNSDDDGNNHSQVVSESNLTIPGKDFFSNCAVSFSPSGTAPLKRYFSRKHATLIRTNDLPLEKSSRGAFTPAGVFFFVIKLTVPLAYMYILLVLLREISIQFPDTVVPFLQKQLPFLAGVVSGMRNISKLVELWAVIEAVFYMALVLQIQWLNHKDPLEASLSSAPMLELDERCELWRKIMESESDDPVEFITGWFFDENLENISRYDLRDFITWSMFESRNQEHLTRDELHQLDQFVEEIEFRVSVHIYGVKENHDNEQDDQQKITPKKLFHFQCGHDEESPSFFTNLYDNYRQKYESYRSKLDNTDFHPVQDFRNYMSHKKQQLYSAEESAKATVCSIYENAYFTLVEKGSDMDKQLSLLSHATHCQLTEAWNQMCEMKERLETAQFISARKKFLLQQRKGYELLLHSMRSMSSSIPSCQMADLMRKITQCNEHLEHMECSARESFTKATGFALKNLMQRKEPQRYAKYSSDPLLGISTYPLVFHLLILSVTDGGLRLLMKMRGFQRRSLGKISYYYHSGINQDIHKAETNPIVFIHGIGIGLIYYMNFIDSLLKLGKPIFLPEIPYVTGFRTWLSPNAVLTPAAVANQMTAMLATHGFLKATFAGHSYGTSWLSYMCKLAPNSLEAIVFLDPICFCLHLPFLTKQFVYHRADPGSVGFMIRTDVIINWTIQRGFPWSRISLFADEINVPCAVFLSDQDALVPTLKVEKYLKSTGACMQESPNIDSQQFIKNPLTVSMFRGLEHGDFVAVPSMMENVVDAIDTLRSCPMNNDFGKEG